MAPWARTHGRRSAAKHRVWLFVGVGTYLRAEDSIRTSASYAYRACVVSLELRTRVCSQTHVHRTMAAMVSIAR